MRPNIQLGYHPNSTARLCLDSVIIPHTWTDILKKSKIPNLNWQYAISHYIYTIKIYKYTWHHIEKKTKFFITKQPYSPSQPPTPKNCHTKCRIPNKNPHHFSQTYQTSRFWKPVSNALSVQLCTGLRASGRPIIPTFRHPIQTDSGSHRFHRFPPFREPWGWWKRRKLPRVIYGWLHFFF